MNKIEKLIKELCPNGVEWKKLGEIGSFVRGNGLQKTDFTEKGVGCIHYGQIYTYYNLFTDKTKSYVSSDLAEKLKKVETGDIVLACTSENIEDICKCVVWEGSETIVTSGHASIFKHNQNSRYIAYFFQSNLFVVQKIKYVYGAKVIDIKNDDLSKIQIPLPPLPIQTEIVRILDKFVEQQEQLERLIELRKKQYEYYREEMLKPKEGEMWETKTLGEICELFTGGEPPLNSIKGDTPDDENIYPIYGNGTEIYGYSNSYRIENDAVCISSIGANTGTIFFHEGKFTPIIRLKVLVPMDDSVSSKFLFYSLQKANIKHKGGGIPNINANDVKKIQVTIPSKKIQNEVVNSLMNFESSITTLTTALELSKKRYEYYRDELLKFHNEF